MTARSQRIQRAFFWAGSGSCLVAVVAAAGIVLNVRSQRRAVADQVQARHRLQLAGATERISHYFDEIWCCLGLIAKDDNVTRMAKDPTGRLEAVYEANYARHQLAEIYVIPRDFDGSEKPAVTFEKRDEKHDAEELHRLDRETAEHQVQITHIRRFAEDRGLESVISDPVPLCVGGAGLVCSVPVYAADRFVGIVAAMVPLEILAGVLEQGRLGDALLLANRGGTVLGCQGRGSDMRTWFEERFARQSASAFFAQQGDGFRAGDYEVVWTTSPVAHRDPMYVALLYDEEAYLAMSGVANALTGWATAALVLLLGGALMFLCSMTPALLRAREVADAQARRSAEQAARTRAIVDTAADGIITFDESGSIESFNRAAETMFGLSAGEALGCTIDTLVRVAGPGSDDPTAPGLRVARGAAGAERQNDCEGLRRDGATFPLEVSVSEVNGSKRRLFTGIFRDVSERRQAEEALRESQRFLQRVVDGIADSIVVVDRDGGIVLANRAAREMTHRCGLPSGCMAGRRDLTRCQKQCSDTLCPCALDLVLATNAPAIVTHTCADAGGNEVVVEIHAAPVFDEVGRVVQLIEARRDVTARVRAEQKARAHQTELAHVSRLTTVGELASGLAHELNQPLCAILSLTQACQRLLRSKHVDTTEVGDAMAEVSAQAKRAGIIIRRLRDFVRKQATERASADLNKIIREAVAFTEVDLRASEVALRLALSDALPQAEVDVVQVQQVVLNLVRNAIEAMRDVAPGQRELHIRSSLSESGEIVVAVRDAGIGFPPEGPDRIYDPFFTTKPSGMGIGLSISRSIIEAHRGRLWATANPDRGVTFYFTIATTEEQPSNGHKSNGVCCRR